MVDVVFVLWFFWAELPCGSLGYLSHLFFLSWLHPLYLFPFPSSLFATAGRNRGRPADGGWMKKVAYGGTLSDRQAAVVLQIQEAPFHRLDMLDGLLAFQEKKSPREALVASGA